MGGIFLNYVSVIFRQTLRVVPMPSQSSNDHFMLNFSTRHARNILYIFCGFYIYWRKEKNGPDNQVCMSDLSDRINSNNKGQLAATKAVENER